MKYYKNSELTLRYNISDKTVRNWIMASREGKLGLKLFEQNNKFYITDSVANNYLLIQLAAKGKRYRNNRTHKNIYPQEKFYSLYSTQQIINLANDLDKHRELSWSYSYFGEAAEYWDRYLKELNQAGKGNIVTNTVEVLSLNFEYIDRLIEPYKHVNIVNVCVGNNLAVRDTLAHIQKSGKLRRFIMADISPDVLKISEQNIKEWFNGSIKTEKHLLDIRHDDISEILAYDSFGDDASETINLIFFIAGPIVNFKDPDQVLKNLYDSMSGNDILFITLKRDTDQTRGFFDFNIKSDTGLLSYSNKVLPDLLGIEESFYEAEQVYEEHRKLRYIQIRLKVAISLHIEVEKFKKTIELQKGETIFIWSSRQYPDPKIIELLARSGFATLQSSQSLDNELLLTISRITTH